MVTDCLIRGKLIRNGLELVSTSIVTIKLRLNAMMFLGHTVTGMVVKQTKRDGCQPRSLI